MHRPSRAEIFALASRKLRQDFEELRMVPHSGVKGMESEGLLRDFLNAHLPMRFRATAGFIIDHDDQVSAQTDIILYDALNCPLYRASEDSAIVPNDNVAAIVEVKSLLDKERLRDAAEKVSIAKSLKKTRPQKKLIGGPDEPINYETLGYLFAFDSPLSPETLSVHYKATIEDFGLGKHIDFVFVLDREMLSLAADPLSDNHWAPILYYQAPPLEGMHLAVGSLPCGESALDVFIRTLLTHLQYFRHSIDHPGFNWGTAETGKQVRLDYLTSVTHEMDPEKRKLRLAIYREAARRHIMGDQSSQ